MSTTTGYFRLYSQKGKDVYHFGYGSNLSSAYTKKMLPSSKFFMKAYLLNFSVQFQFWSESDKSGLSNISMDSGQMVHGILFDVSEKELKLLDEMEVFNGNYKRETFLTLGEDGKCYHADLYRVIEPRGPFTPSRSYVEVMLAGAREHGLDPDYIKKIQAFYDKGK